MTKRKSGSQLTSKTLNSQPAAGVVVEIAVPLAPLDEAAYMSSHVEVRRLDVPQRTALRRLRNGLNAAGARLANTKFVESPADAVRWLLEQIAGG